MDTGVQKGLSKDEMWLEIWEGITRPRTPPKR